MSNSNEIGELDFIFEEHAGVLLRFLFFPTIQR